MIYKTRLLSALREKQGKERGLSAATVAECIKLAEEIPEDDGLEPEEIAAAQKAMRAALGLACELQAYKILGSFDHLRELVQAEKDGRLVVLPFVAMVEQSLQDGEMKPQRDQRFNGRYAVVYADKKKWASPLIDICGHPYNREQAEERLAELTREEAEAALEALEALKG